MPLLKKITCTYLSIWRAPLLPTGMALDLQRTAAVRFIRLNPSLLELPETLKQITTTSTIQGVQNTVALAMSNAAKAKYLRDLQLFKAQRVVLAVRWPFQSTTEHWKTN